MFPTTSVTELRDKLSETIDALNEENAIMVVRRSKPAAYLVSTAMFESLLERIETLEDQCDMQAAVLDYQAGKAVEAEDVFERLGL